MPKQNADLPSGTVASEGAGQNGAERPAYPVGSVDNALRLLLLVSERQGVRIAEASEELGVARSTAHRTMQMLQYYGFVDQDPESRAYRVGPALVDLGLRAVRGLDLRKLAEPAIESLVEVTGETVHLLTPQGQKVLCIHSVEGPGVLRVGERTGMLLDAHATAAGRALLAELPRERLREIYPSVRLPRVTGKTIDRRPELEAELARVREQGYSVQVDEYEAGVGALGVAVKDSGGHPRCAIAVAVPTTRFREEDVPKIAAAATAAAAEIGIKLPW